MGTRNGLGTKQPEAALAHSILGLLHPLVPGPLGGPLLASILPDSMIPPFSCSVVSSQASYLSFSVSPARGLWHPWSLDPWGTGVERCLRCMMALCQGLVLAVVVVGQQRGDKDTM